MSKTLKFRAKRVGLPPGTLIDFGELDREKVRLSIIDYDAKHILEKRDPSLKECLVSLKDPSITWINVCGIHDVQTVSTLGKHFNLHPLMLEDIMTIGQRPKLDDYKNTIFIVLRMLKYDDQKEKTDVEQISIVLGRNYLISFTENQHDVFAPLRDRLRNSASHLRQRGADYLCYALIDCIVDNYFLILEKVDEKMVGLEEELIKHPHPRILQAIQNAKREIILLRKSVWPTREVISSIRRLDTLLIQDSTKFYFQDVYDHTIQAIDTIESFRDITSGMLDIYLSNISQRMNEIMKVLTIVSTIFVPLTFIASVFGMNFQYFPELHWKWGYPMALALMLLTAVGMVYYFVRKKWI